LAAEEMLPLLMVRSISHREEEGMVTGATVS
jgi:hypothetical protein